jgi:opacity protein-like surface antigen
MKRMLRGVAIGFAVAMSAQAAQAQSNLSLGVGGGAVVPTGSLADIGKTGWNATLSARLKPAPSPIGFQLDGFYNRFAFDGIDGHTSILGASANALFALPGVIAHPYLIGGLGVYNMRASVDGVGSGSDTKFGFNGGLGVDVGVGPAKLYAEGRLHAIMKGTVDSQSLEETTAYMVPLTVGLRWSLR